MEDVCPRAATPRPALIAQSCPTKRHPVSRATPPPTVDVACRHPRLLRPGMPKRDGEGSDLASARGCPEPRAPARTRRTPGERTRQSAKNNVRVSRGRACSGMQSLGAWRGWQRYRHGVEFFSCSFLEVAIIKEWMAVYSTKYSTKEGKDKKGG